MNHTKKFRVEPDAHVRLKDYDPSFVEKGLSKKDGLEWVEKLKKKMYDLQFKLYSERRQSLLICLQAPDAGGKDGVCRHVFGALNPQGCRVKSFKEPSAEELAHDFLWRIEKQTPERGEVVVFNRSQYEDVLVVRVHDLVPKPIWSKRYDQINDFEKRLSDSGTHILKFFLHISKEEQLERFKARLDEPDRQWKISEADYTERDCWETYQDAYEAVLRKCSTASAPWFVIPSNHKWFRDVAIAQIVVEALEGMNIQVPKPTVDLAEIRKKYHQDAESEASK